MKIAVIEDSALAREGLISMLSAYPDLELTISADHPDTALQPLTETPADALFLDIHMPGKSGFELLGSLSYSPLLVFTTAYSEYAIRSFDFNTVDYLLKPISRERLDQAVSRLRQQFAAFNPTAQDHRVPQQEPVLEMNSRLLFRDKGACHLTELGSIHYFESCKNDARAFFGGQRAFIKRSLNHLEQRLPEKRFFRANRQFIVNLQAVKSIEESIGRGFWLIMADGREIEISRRRAVQLMEILSI